MNARQSTARTFMMGPVLDSTGAAVTGAVVGDFKVSKNGGAPAALNGSTTVTHRHTGNYSVASATGDFDTVGTAQFTLDKSTDTCSIVAFDVIEETVYDGLFASGSGSSSFLPIDVKWVAGSPDAANGLSQAGQDYDNNTYLYAGVLNMAANVLTASALATDAVQEIRNAITGGAYALSTDANGRIRIVDGTGAGELNTLSGGVFLGVGVHAGAGSSLTLDNFSLTNFDVSAITAQSFATDTFDVGTATFSALNVTTELNCGSIWYGSQFAGSGSFIVGGNLQVDAGLNITGALDIGTGLHVSDGGITANNTAGPGISAAGSTHGIFSQGANGSGIYGQAGGAAGNGITGLGVGIGAGIAAIVAGTGPGAVFQGGSGSAGIRATGGSGSAGAIFTGTGSAPGADFVGGNGVLGYGIRAQSSGSGTAGIIATSTGLGGCGILVAGTHAISSHGIRVSATQGNALSLDGPGGSDLLLTNSLSPTLANVIWNALQANHLTAATMGKGINSIRAAVYDSAVATGPDTLTLSDGAVQLINAAGRTTT